MAGIALAGVRYDKWIRFMLPLMGLLFVASLVMLGIAAAHRVGTCGRSSSNAGYDMSDATISYLVLGLAVIALHLEPGARRGGRRRRHAGALRHRRARRRSRASPASGPAVIYIASLFVVSEGLDARGGDRLGRAELTGRAGTAEPGWWSRRTMLLVAVLTALISVNGAVAALVPMVVVLALRIRQPSSQLMMPLAVGGRTRGHCWR